MPFKFEQLNVWQASLEYIDQIYSVASKLPKSEEFNLKSQIIRAATSIALNIAEGSIGQTNIEQARFLGIALRSLIETVACIQIIRRRSYNIDTSELNQLYEWAESLSKQLYTFRKSIDPNQRWIREDQISFDVEGEA